MKTHPTVNSALKLIPYLTLPMRKVVLSMCQLGVTYELICNMGTSKVSEYPFLGSIIPLYLKNSEPYNKQLEFRVCTYRVKKDLPRWFVDLHVDPTPDWIRHDSRNTM